VWREGKKGGLEQSIYITHDWCVMNIADMQDKTRQNKTQNRQLTQHPPSASAELPVVST
jgi:hypothetical protein